MKPYEQHFRNLCAAAGTDYERLRIVHDLAREAGSRGVIQLIDHRHAREANGRKEAA